MAKHKTDTFLAKTDDPEHESQEVLDAEEIVDDQVKGNHKVTQAEAVRQAIAAGCETAKTGVPFVQKHFGITLSSTGFAAAKSQINRADAKREGREVPSTPRATTQHQANSVALPNSFGADIITIRGLLSGMDPDELKDHINTIARLQQTYGSANLDKMIDGFA